MSRSNVRRANVTACTRCRTRKQRCDQNLPACSNCLRAGADCTSTDTDGTVAPRSYIKNLEDHVAYLENLLAFHGVRDVGTSSPTDLPRANPSLAPTTQLFDHGPDVMDGQVLANSLQTGSFSREFAGQSGLSLLRSLLSGPIGLVSQTVKPLNGRSIADELPQQICTSMPPQEVVRKLTEAYFEHSDFFSPIMLSKSDFLSSTEELHDDISAASQHHINAKFQAMMVFAIAVLLLNRTDPSVPMARSEAYFNAAVELLSGSPDLTCTGNLDHLANLLLVVQDCSFSSNLAGAWHFVGLATRLAIELGLHQANPASAGQSAHQVSQRRWLFWSTYVLERNLCVVTGRPFSIPDESISVSLPTVEESDPRRALAVHMIECRRLESEIYATLHYHSSPNGAVLDRSAWRENMRQRLVAWHDSVPALEYTSQLAPAGTFDGMFYINLVQLYYPSQHLPSHSASDLAMLSRSAIETVNCYKHSFRAGELRFYWRTVHNLFRSGMAAVYCTRASRLQPDAQVDLNGLANSIQSCCSLLWGMVERYPAARAYRDIFENVVDSLNDRNEHQEPAGPLYQDLNLAGTSSQMIDVLSWDIMPTPSLNQYENNPDS